MIAIVLCCGVIGGQVLSSEFSIWNKATQGESAARLAGLTFAASTRISFERGPTNGALGADLPLPDDRRKALTDNRAATDAALEAVVQALPGSMAAAPIAQSVEATRQDLARVRQKVDRLLQEKLSNRSSAELNGVIAELIAVVPKLAPALNATEAAMARADPAITNLVTIARLSTEMRDYAGQLGSVFTAALIGKRPLTGDETALLEHINGYVAALNSQIRLSSNMLPHDEAMDRSLDEIDAHFFGAGKALVRGVADIGRTSGGYGMTPAEFAARYVPEMLSIVALRDAAVARFTDQIQQVTVSARGSLLANGLAVVILLGVVGTISGLIRERASKPLTALSSGLERMAGGEWGTAIQVETRSDEIGAVITAIGTMQASLLARERQNQTLMEEKDRTADILRHTNLLFDTALNNMSHGLLLCDADMTVVVVNHKFYEIYGIDPAAAGAGTPYRDFLALSLAAGNHPGCTMDDVIAQCVPRFQGKKRTEAMNRIRSGRTIAVSYERMADGGWIGTHEDVTEREMAQANIAFMAHHDALTRLPNRVLFRDRIGQAIAQLGRDRMFAVIHLDLDRFKQINDRLGHPAGDGLLVAVAHMLQSCVREGDTVARLGGDEFAILQLGIQQQSDVELLTDRILKAFRQPLDVLGQRILSATSLGVVIARHDNVSYDTLMRDADIALYQAKLEGRGTARFFEPEMDARIELRRALEKDLQGAAERNEFELYYQPQVDLVTNEVTGFEALVRWNHPKHGRVSPLDFIPVAEETGQIVEIGAWVLRTACFEAKAWPDDITVAVNLSPVQFKRGDLAGNVREILARSGLRPERLELEITESVFLRDTAETLTALNELRALGVSVALDDFGTGYSSLSYLRSFSFHKLKIDQSFVRGIPNNKESLSIIRAVARLGESLGIRIIVEGVETAEQLAFLREEGCREIQGFLYSPPVSADAVPDVIESVRSDRADYAMLR